MQEKRSQAPVKIIMIWNESDFDLEHTRYQKYVPFSSLSVSVYSDLINVNQMKTT